MKNLQKKNNKLSLKESVALSVFMEIVPKLITLWKNQNCNLTFDAWLLERYEEAKKVKK